MQISGKYDWVLFILVILLPKCIEYASWVVTPKWQHTHTQKYYWLSGVYIHASHPEPSIINKTSLFNPCINQNIVSDYLNTLDNVTPFGGWGGGGRIGTPGNSDERHYISIPSFNKIVKIPMVCQSPSSGSFKHQCTFKFSKVQYVQLYDKKIDHWADELSTDAFGEMLAICKYRSSKK